MFLFGLSFGSFLNVCIYRIPRALPEEEPEEGWLRSLCRGVAAWRSVQSPPRSFCPSCHHPIRWYDNLPVVSWLLLRGRCRDCRQSISIRYASVELLTAVLFLSCYLRFGASLETGKFCIFTFLTIGLIFSDAEHRLLPDAFTVPGALLGVLFSRLVPLTGLAHVLPLLLRMPLSLPMYSLLDSVLGALIGALFIYASGLVYRIARGQEGMGFGDVKMMAMIGAFLGVKLALLTILLASLLGSLFGLVMFLAVWVKRCRRYLHHRRPMGAAARRAWTSARMVRFYAIPFGVFLGIVGLFSAFLGDVVLHWYWGLF